MRTKCTRNSDERRRTVRNIDVEIGGAGKGEKLFVDRLSRDLSLSLSLSVRPPVFSRLSQSLALALFFQRHSLALSLPESQVEHGEGRVPCDLLGHLEEGRHVGRQVFRGERSEGLQQDKVLATLMAGLPMQQSKHQSLNKATRSQLALLTCRCPTGTAGSCTGSTA